MIREAHGNKLLPQRRNLHHRWLAGAALLALTGWGCGSEDAQQPPAPAGETPQQKPPGVRAVEYSPGSVIVRFKDTDDAAGLASVRASSLARIKGTFEDKNGDGVYDRFANVDRGGHLIKVDLDRSVTVEAALAELRRDPAVAYAEPNYLQHITARTALVPNDPRFGELYGLHNTGQLGGVPDADIDAPEAWNLSTGSSDVVVGVIDTGVDYTHPDLAANMWVNPLETAGNGVDDDGNGVVDDVHGFNALNGSGDPMDDNNHGTHCSGTIGGAGSNGVGVAGVNWEVSIMAIKFLDSFGGGTTAGAIESVDYAIGRKLAGVNLRVLSNSWGGGGFSQGLKDAIDAAGEQDILFVAAAGNDFGSNNDTFPFYPASYPSPNVVAVAATNRFDGLAFFSNIGPTSVDLGAPGEAILSTTLNNTYSVFSGTSMATPHVAGAAALVLSVNDTLSTEELKQLLMDSGDAKPSLAGVTASGRRLNAANALVQAGPPTPRFNLGVAPASQTISQADSAAFSINLTEVAGFTGDVALTVASQPAIDATLTITPSTVAVPGTATLDVVTAMTTEPGIYTLTVTGTSGALTRSRQLSLKVLPFGTIEKSYPSTDTPITIPDSPAAGIDSTIHVSDAFALQQVKVDLSITHPFFIDIIATLTSPTGTTVTLQSISNANPNRTFIFPAQFAGEAAEGDWTLHVSDALGGGVGTLNSWTLHLSNVVSAATFELAMATDDFLIIQDNSLFSAVEVQAIEGFSSPVSLSFTSEPELLNASVFLSPSTVNAPGVSSLLIFTSCSTAAGIYDLTITGQSGGLVKTVHAKLTILPAGSAFEVRNSFDTPRAIPDNNPNGTTSTINAFSELSISQLSVGVDIVHPAIGELVVQLLSPSGQVVTLHDRTGGTDDNLHRFYDVPGFEGTSLSGAWRLKVIDGAGQQTGSLQGWTLRAADTRLAPTASFSFNQSFLSFEFIDFSHDAFSFCSSGSIESWHWDFGDGTTSDVRQPSHVYAAAGEYEVTLTVTDDDGNTDAETRSVTATRPPPELAIERITRNRAKLEFAVDLTWSGADGTQVDLLRNNALVDIPNNDGAHRDVFRRYDTSYTWNICEQRSFFCSNTVSVNFGSSLSSSGAEPVEATVVTKHADGSESSRVVRIEEQ
jgi:subtilisin family serine protease/subtilisin-like proprotein convertase family protein